MIRHDSFDGLVVKGWWHLDSALWFDGEHARGPTVHGVHVGALMLADEPRVSVTIGEKKSTIGGIVLQPEAARELISALSDALARVEAVSADASGKDGVAS